MEDFNARYKKLNTAQRQAVDHIDGPLLVVAGPGTGKTELLSMRAANILRQTDALPENILCLTFTDSGANAMRARLASIIGADAYKVAIQTFHSFGTEVINQNGEYFYKGANFAPADEIATYTILTEIFQALSHRNPLAGTMNGEFTHLRDAASVISELKRAGLTSRDLLEILDANDALIDAVESEFSAIFANRMSKTTTTLMAPLAAKIAALPQQKLPPAITPLADALALSLARAFDEAIEADSTTPVTAWRKTWFEKNLKGDFVFRNRKRQAKLRALAPIYDQYLARMNEAELFDYDDMILNVLQAIERHPDLRANLQERYQYIMVDEFQDTNLAQLRILFDLGETPAGDAPNVMAVGDDDQAIYSFQGADVGNIHRFRKQYPDHASVVLTENYRSSQKILDLAREVITQATGRLEDSMEIDKHLHAQTPGSDGVDLSVLPTRQDEFSWVAKSIKNDINSGKNPAEIAVIARRHSDLMALVPYLNEEKISVNYERRDNILEDERVKLLELMTRICVSISENHHDEADSLLPELVAHPMYNFDSESIWRLSLRAYRNRQQWLETMLASSDFQDFAKWIIDRAKASVHEPLEIFLDSLIGAPKNQIYQNFDEIPDESFTSGALKNSKNSFVSPFFDYYFGAGNRGDSAENYLSAIEALRTLRDKLREKSESQNLRARDFLELTETYRRLKVSLTSARNASESAQNSVNLMSSHKAKGLEFDTVYVINSVDSMWGERVRSRNRLINYPENLTISPNADDYNERVRLYFVAMTRAKRHLHLSYSLQNDTEKDTLKASFLANVELAETRREQPSNLTKQAEIAWHDRLTTPVSRQMRELLTPTLEHYKLSATHLNNFVDIVHGGPQSFLLSNLLRFPQAPSPNLAYGTQIHRALQRAHADFSANGKHQPIEKIIDDFKKSLRNQDLSEHDFEYYANRGAEALEKFLSEKYQTFTKTQKPELNFANQNAFLGEARLTGSLDLVEISENSLAVTDYKTGKPSNSWTGKSDAEKIKLHKYRQQLMFYELLCAHSRDYARYDFAGASLQFVEANENGEIIALDDRFSEQELADFAKLIAAVWRCIMTLELPPTDEFTPNYKGILEFERFLIDKYAQ